MRERDRETWRIPHEVGSDSFVELQPRQQLGCNDKVLQTEADVKTEADRHTAWASEQRTADTRAHARARAHTHKEIDRSIDR